MEGATAALRERLEQLATLNAIGEVLNQEPTFATAAERALARLIESLGLQAGWLFVTRVAHGDTKGGALALSSCHGIPPALASDDAAPLREEGCDCQWLFRAGRLDAGVNIVRCSRLEAASGDKAGLEVHASIPLLGKRGPVGIMNLAAPGRERFDEPTLAFLTAVGRQLGIAFERSRLLDERTRETRYSAALEERQRLAVEMHDGVAQLLFAAELSLHSALRTVPTGASAWATPRVWWPTPSSGCVRSSRCCARSIPTPLSTRSCAVSPSVWGAPSRCRSSCGRGRCRRGGSAGRRATQALYRVAQEATHNVLKHARASRLWLRLGADGGVVTLSVLDDGVGPPDEATLAASGGLGLASLRHRLAEVGGSLRLSARPGGGTVVEARVPWRV
jgi:two-component system, NarL family, sensor kinase